MRSPLALAGLSATVVATVAAVIVLREATMTVHHPVPAGSRLDVVVQAESNLRDDRSVEARTGALVELCRAEAADGTSVTEFTRHDDGRFALTIEPSLDESDQRQLQGCLQDLRLPHLQLRVVSIDHVGPDPAASQRG